MARHRIHSVVVLPDPTAPPGADRGWGVISELDLVGAAPFEDPETTAGRVAGTPVVVIAPDEPLLRASMLMAEYAVSHLLVVPPEGEPVGIVSALDVARALAPPAEAPPAPGAPRRSPGGSLVAAPGDRLVIRGHHVGEPDRDAEILEVRGEGGTPPFLVRWEDSGRESLFYPGSDAHVERLAEG
jgi:CBS domain-containing protein